MDAGSTPAISITFSLLKRKSNQKEKNIRSGDIEYTTYFNLDLLSPSLVNYIFIAARTKTRLLNYFSLLKRKSNQKEKNIRSGDIEYTTYFNLDLLSPSLVNYIFIAARTKTRLLNYFSLLKRKSNQKEKNIGSGDIYPRHLILQELKKKRAYCQLTKK